MLFLLWLFSKRLLGSSGIFMMADNKETKSVREVLFSVREISCWNSFNVARSS